MLAGTNCRTSGHERKPATLNDSVESDKQNTTNSVMVDLLTQQHLQAKENGDQIRMDIDRSRMPRGQRLQQAVADINRAQKFQDKLAKQLPRATGHRDDVLRKISDNTVELAE
ncbi:unnamed protein product, partial [Prorocentrum cordatum]